MHQASGGREDTEMLSPHPPLLTSDCSLPFGSPNPCVGSSFSTCKTGLEGLGLMPSSFFLWPLGSP